MPLPLDLVLVRHGESEGNLANKRDRAGDSSLITPDHVNRHSSSWRLTENGIVQAKTAGAWIAANIPGQFDKYLVSPFVRARETAGYLNLPNAEWEVDPYLIERDHGDLDGKTKAEREAEFGHNLAKRALHEFYWRPPNGETRLETGLRWDRVMQALSQRHSDRRVIIVAHETLIEAGLIRRLHWSVEQFCRWKEADDPTDKIHNCQIIHFTRRDPKSGVTNQGVRWWRSICPWDSSLSDPAWRTIEKKFYSGQDLLDQANEFPRVINM